MQLTHVFVFVATVVASVNALATPVHGVRMSHRHSTIAKARAPAPEAAISSPFASKRGLKKRCKPRTSTSSLVFPSGIANAGNAPVTSSVEATSAPAPAPTSEAAPTTEAAPTSEAPAPVPTTSSKTKAAPTTSEAPAPAPTSEAPAPAPTTSSKTKAAPTTTQAPAPPPTSEAPAPAPTTSSKKPTSSSQAPQTTQASSGGSPISGLGQFAGTLSGQGTWYDTGLTACGVTNNDSEFIAAVSHLMFDTFPGYAGTNPNNNPICGRKAQVTYQGKTITVTITDRCTACAVEDLDFTPTAFQQLAPLGAGRISGVSWHFIS